MKELVIKIKERHYKLFLQFLQTLDYVTVIKPSTATGKEKASSKIYDFLIWRGLWSGRATLYCNNAL